MKKSALRLVSLALVLVMGLFTFASCGKLLTGSYSNSIDISVAGTNTTLTFKLFNKVEKVTETTLLGTTKTTTEEGTYKISENEDGETVITLTFEEDDGDTVSTAYSFASGTDSDGKDYISLEGLKFYKEK